MTWVNIREKLSKEEIVEVASKDAITSTPIDNVVFDGKEIKEVLTSLPVGFETDEEKVAWALNFLLKSKNGERTE